MNILKYMYLSKPIGLGLFESGGQHCGTFAPREIVSTIASPTFTPQQHVSLVIEDSEPDHNGQCIPKS